MIFSPLSAERRMRGLTVGVAATFALYLLTALIAEPMRSLAANTSDNVKVSVVIGDVLSLACFNNSHTGSGTVSLGTIAISGDTGAYSDTRAAVCFAKNSSANGFDFGWYIRRGSGGSMTGYLINTAESSIAPYGTGSGRLTTTWSVASNDSRWGARISSTSSGVNMTVLNGQQFDTDGGSEKWGRVKTGSTLTLRRYTGANTAGSGVMIKVGFRVQVGAAKNQPSGTYETPYATGTGGVIFTINAL